MRFCLRVWAATALCLVMFDTGTASADVPRTPDGDGVMVGSGAAPVQLEIFCDPQRPDCAESESTYGDSNALFLAADPTTPETVYQAFVQDLYRHQSPDGPNNNDIAAMARESGVPEAVADRIAAGDYAIDAATLNHANRARLNQVNPANPGTPTVYDLKANRVVDIQDPGWLDDLSS
jgi:hypothetical protein